MKKKNNKKKLIILIACTLYGISHAAKNPIPLATDQRIKVVSYSPNDITKVNGKTFVTTQIFFDSDEQVVDIECGDSTSWEAVVSPTSRNIINLKPVAVGSNTSLNVQTVDHLHKKRSYFFNIISDESSKTTPTYAIKFQYPAKRLTEKRYRENYFKSQKNAELNIGRSPGKYNYDYTFWGSKTNMPLHVFDDGRYTYFQFFSNQNIPAIFATHDKSGSETVVDFRINGSTVTVLQVSPQFSLRNNGQVAVVFNEKLIKKIKKRA